MHNDSSTVRRPSVAARIGALLTMATLAFLGSVTAAFAQDPDPVTQGTTAANTAIGVAADAATSVIVAGIPVVLAVAAVWMGLKFGKRLIGAIR